MPSLARFAAAPIDVHTALPQATIVTSSPERRVAALLNGTRTEGSMLGISPRMIDFLRALISSGFVGSPGKAGPSNWR